MAFLFSITVLNTAGMEPWAYTLGPSWPPCSSESRMYVTSDELWSSNITEISPRSLGCRSFH